VIDHARRRKRQVERLQQRQLQRLGRLGAKRRKAVDDADAELFEVGEIVQRVKNAVAAAAQIGGRAHAIEDEAVLRAVAVGRIVRMSIGIQRLVVHAAAIELREKRTKPVRMFVIDADGSCSCHVIPQCYERKAEHFAGTAPKRRRPGKHLAFRASF
jgi:hypothetical protein